LNTNRRTLHLTLLPTPQTLSNSLERLIAYQRQTNIEPISDAIQARLPAIMNTIVDLETLLQQVIDWNAIVKMVRYYYAPMMLLMLPFRKNSHYHWSDVRIKFEDFFENTEYFWRYQPQSKEDYETNSFVPQCLKNIHQETIVFQGKTWNVNMILKGNDSFLIEQPWDEEETIPLGCFSLMDSDANAKLDQFVKENKEENDQPYIFLTRSLDNPVASCMTRSTLERMGQESSAKYYECMTESNKYVFTDRTYVKLAIFSDYQTYVTLENYKHLLQDTTHTYFYVDPKPFYSVAFSTSHSYYHEPKGMLENETEEQATERLEGVVFGSDHCQAGSDKQIVVIYSV